MKAKKCDLGSRLLAVMWLALAALILAACGGAETDPGTAGGDTGAAETDAAADPRTGDPQDSDAGDGPEQAAGPATTWQHQTIAPEGWFGSQAETRWGEAIAEATDGQLTLEMFYAAGLNVTDSQVFRALADGVLESADYFGPSTAGEVGIANAIELPFLIPYDMELRREIVEEIRPVLEQTFAERGVIMLAMVQLEPRNLYTSTPVNSLEDLSGLQIRTVGPQETQLTEDIGATPVAIDAAEVYTALQQGVVDGYWLTHSTTRDFNFYEVINHSWEVSQGGAAWYVGVNQAAFEALSPDVQATVTELALEMEDEMWTEVPQVVDETRAFLEDNGVTVNSDVPEDDLERMREASQPIWDEWLTANGEQGQQLFDTIQSRIDG